MAGAEPHSVASSPSSSLETLSDVFLSNAGDGKDDFAEVDEQNAFGVFTDSVTEKIFSYLHANDESGVKDSSKNLRVLWVRAMLNNFGDIDDDVAAKLLPRDTENLVTSEFSKKYLGPIKKFAEWISSRTAFIDSTLDSFLDFNKGSPCNVVLFGSGYDTRALRYRKEPRANFYEVDLPSVIEGKEKLYQMYLRDHPDGAEKGQATSKFLGVDLNTYKDGGLVSDIYTYIYTHARAQ